MEKILIIEDDKVVRENLREFLISEGYEAVMAENGEEGYRMAIEYLPDLILCDILMPDLDGYGVLMKLSEDAQTASIPFIFLTALTEESYQRKGMNLGADDYLCKPFTRETLFKTITARLKKNRMLSHKIKEHLSTSQPVESLRTAYEARTALENVIASVNDMKKAVPENNILMSHLVKIETETEKVIQNYRDLLFSMELEQIRHDPLKMEELNALHLISVRAAIQNFVKVEDNRSSKPCKINLGIIEDVDIKIGEDHFYRILEYSLNENKNSPQYNGTIEIFGVVNQNTGMYDLMISSFPLNTSYLTLCADENERPVPDRIHQILDLYRAKANMYIFQNRGLIIKYQFLLYENQLEAKDV